MMAASPDGFSEPSFQEIDQSLEVLLLVRSAETVQGHPLPQSQIPVLCSRLKAMIRTGDDNQLHVHSVCPQLLRNQEGILYRHIEVTFAMYDESRLLDMLELPGWCKFRQIAGGIVMKLPDSAFVNQILLTFPRLALASI